jgi:hypothetical protein
MMDRLEDKLRDVLKRKEPPAGFAERVLARTLETKQNVWTSIFASRGLRWGLVGALCLTLVMVGIEYRQAQEERARSEAAKEQLLLALRIAGDQLQFVWSKVNQP